MGGLGRIPGARFFPGAVFPKASSEEIFRTLADGGNVLLGCQAGRHRRPRSLALLALSDGRDVQSASESWGSLGPRVCRTIVGSGVAVASPPLVVKLRLDA